jgi:hypothetical protein
LRSAVSAPRALELARNWGAEAGILSGAGHINVKSGHQRWEQGFAYLYRLQNRMEHHALRRAWIRHFFRNASPSPGGLGREPAMSFETFGQPLLTFPDAEKSPLSIRAKPPGDGEAFLKKWRIQARRSAWCSMRFCRR